MNYRSVQPLKCSGSLAGYSYPLQNVVRFYCPASACLGTVHFSSHIWKRRNTKCGTFVLFIAELTWSWTISWNCCTLIWIYCSKDWELICISISLIFSCMPCILFCMFVWNTAADSWHQAKSKSFCLCRKEKRLGKNIQTGTRRMSSLQRKGKPRCNAAVISICYTGTLLRNHSRKSTVRMRCGK